MAWVWCAGLGGWAAHAGAYRPGRHYPIVGSNDPDLSGIITAGLDVYVISAAAAEDPCTLDYYSVPHVAYYDDGGNNWQDTGPNEAGGTVPPGTDLYLLVSGPNYDITDPAPTWDAADALDWLHDPPPGPPTFAGTEAMDYSFNGTGVGSSTHYLSFAGMGVPPFSGDIVFGFAYQELDNPDLAVSSGWTVDHQHADSDGSWIVFHRTIVTEGEVGPTVSGIITGAVGYYAGYVWTYRDFYGFDAPVEVAFSTSPVIDLDSPDVVTSEDNSLVSAAWVAPITDVDERVYKPSGTWPTFNERFPGPGASGPLRMWDNRFQEGGPDTYGPITNHRHDLFAPDVDIPSPYFSIIFALLAEAAEPCPPPPNDNVADAEVIVGDSGSVSGTTNCSTSEPGEIMQPGTRLGSDGTGTVWYQWTPSVSGIVQLAFTAGVVETLPSVVQLWSLRATAAVDAPPLGGGPWYAGGFVNVEGGSPYWIQIGSPYGPFTFEWTLTPTPLEPVVVDLDPVPLTSRLGCSQHVAYIQGKCNGPRLCELLDISSLGYDRRLDDISEAFVEIPISGDSENPCCSCLADVEPWCHVLTIVREGDGVVWTGPVQKVTYGYNSVRIDAKDKLAWLKVRVNEIPIDYLNNFTVPLTTIARTIADVAMADDGDSPCFMDCVLDLGDGLPAGTDRSREIFAPFGGPTAFDDFQSIADSGIDYTVINQCLILGPETLPNAPIGTLLDEHILGDLTVTKNGDLLGNRFFVRYAEDEDCVETCTPQGSATCPCPAVAEGEQECYGSVERIVPDDLGLPNVEAATQVAQSFLNASRLVPRQIEFPAGTRLSPETPWGINEMIPGQRIDVSLTKLCIPIFQSFKLQQVQVQDGPDGEEISIDLQTLNVVIG